MQPPDDFNPPIGVAEPVAPELRRMVAPNPSPMTYRGTNTYLVGTRGLAVIDPGPASDVHLEAILNCLGPGQSITHIIVTHAHLDHSPLARPLAARTGAPVLAFGAAHAGRSAVMERLAQSGVMGGGEGIDLGFFPDQTVEDGTQIDGDGWTLDVMHTPGHLSNHIALGLGDICLTGDHVMGWASSLVSPPDGDLTAFMASCTKLAEQDWHAFFPGHGGPVADPAARLNWLVTHRRAREAAILNALALAPATAATLARAIYLDTPAPLLPAAERNVLAHLIDLTGKSQVAPQGPLHANAIFERL